MVEGSKAYLAFSAPFWAFPGEIILGCEPAPLMFKGEQTQH
jgi:hypothetical protein